MPCPRCGYRDVPEDSLTGFCLTCDEKRHVAKYQAQEAEAIATRGAAWRKRSGVPSTSKAAAAARQRRHRLAEAVKPTEPPPPEADPWELAHEALVALAGVHAGVLHNPNLVEKVELAMERVRWLATGPQD